MPFLRSFDVGSPALPARHRLCVVLLPPLPASTVASFEVICAMTSATGAGAALVPRRDPAGPAGLRPPDRHLTERIVGRFDLSSPRSRRVWRLTWASSTALVRPVAPASFGVNFRAILSVTRLPVSARRHRRARRRGAGLARGAAGRPHRRALSCAGEWHADPHRPVFDAGPDRPPRPAATPPFIQHASGLGDLTPCPTCPRCPTTLSCRMCSGGFPTTLHRWLTTCSD